MTDNGKTEHSQVEDFAGKIFSAIGKITDEEVANLIKAEKVTISVAESLSGGLICDKISSFAGASDYFIGGIVCYSNRVKVTELAVPAAIIAKEGPVNQSVAEILADNIRKKFKTSIGISSVGVAGPATVSPPKPIGLVYIAISSDTQSASHEFHFSGSRGEIRAKTAQAAIGLLWMFLTGQN